MQSRDQLLFHVGVPASVGLVLGFDQLGIGHYMSLWASLGFWLIASLGCWAIFEVVGIGTAAALKPWQPPLIAILLVAMIIASLITRPLLYGMADLFEPLMVDGHKPRVPAPVAPTLSFLAIHLRSWAGFFTFWLGVNLVAAYVLGLRRFGHGRTAPVRIVEIAAGVSAPQEGSSIPRFINRIPSSLGSEVIALESEDHYLRVHTRLGNTLILYRLNDAVAELEAAGVDGARIHRSHWVATAAIEAVTCSGRSHNVKLANGLELPVSQTYREGLRRAGVMPTRAVDTSTTSARPQLTTGA